LATLAFLTRLNYLPLVVALAGADDSDGHRTRSLAALWRSLPKRQAAIYVLCTAWVPR
jgi:hypothetical protein